VTGAHQHLRGLARLPQHGLHAAADACQAEPACQTAVIRQAGGAMADLADVGGAAAAEDQAGSRAATVLAFEIRHTRCLA
jgi:hypothetical protein